MFEDSYLTPNQIAEIEKTTWFTHYYSYIRNIAFQRFRWVNLPKEIDPTYLENWLQTNGHLGFWKSDFMSGYCVSYGAIGGRVNHYQQPVEFVPTSTVPEINREKFRIYYYGKKIDDVKYGTIIFNNETKSSSLHAIRLYARELAFLKQVAFMNINAQKTPILVETDDDKLLTSKNIYRTYEENGLSILLNKNYGSGQPLTALTTGAPFVADKVNDYKNQVWNDLMTYLGIKNNNQEKRERLVEAEAEGKYDQVENSSNIFLKAREEGIERIKELYPDLKDLKVELRTDKEEELREAKERDMNE